MKKEVCIHFNGVLNAEVELCGGGVNYRELVGGEDLGWVIRTPCFKSHETNIKCSLYTEPTDEQLKEYEDSWNKALDRIEIAISLLTILKEENPEGGSGIQKCPCCSKKLHWSISSVNNHGRLVCESENCINMIE